MENYQFYSLIFMLAGGFGWLLGKMGNVEGRSTKKFEIIESRLIGIENRLSKMEGAFEERGRCMIRNENNRGAS